MSGNHRRAARANRIRAVVVDYGEVLCHRPSPEDLERMAGVFGIPASDFLDVYIRSRAPYDRGDVTPAAYWTQFAQQAGLEVDAKTIETLRKWDVNMWSRVNRPITDWVAKIHAAAIKTAILSNMQQDMAKHARANFEWLKEFDCQVFSCELRAIKPDPTIYEACLERLQSQPSETLFIDDREQNVEGARAVGLLGLLFQSVERLAADLRQLEFLILPAVSESGGVEPYGAGH